MLVKGVKLKLYQELLNKYNICDYIHENNKVDMNKIDDIEPPKRNPKYEKWLNSGKGAIIAIAAISFIPGATMLSIYLTHLFDITAFKCYTKCKKYKPNMVDICTARCKYNAALWVIDYIQDQIKKARKIENDKERKKVEKQLYSMLIYWRQKRIEYKINLNTVEKYSKSWKNVGV